MKREKLTKSHASSVVILIFTVLFVQGVLFLFRSEELELRKPVEKVPEQSAAKVTPAAKVTIEEEKPVKYKESNRYKTAEKVRKGPALETPIARDSSTENRTEIQRGDYSSDISWNTYKKTEIVQLNTADSTELVSLPGIGPYYAKKILEYRNQLGGFASREQLMEIRGIDRQRYELFASRVSADTNLIHRNSIKEATYEQLAKNPYIGGYLARSIIRFRDENTEAALDLVSLMSANIIKKELYKILKFYFH